MGKIFRYECRRLLWNKFFIGLAVVLLLYGVFVLHAVTILGVAHTAPFSPWSFGDYLSRMMPLLWLGMLFFLTFYTSPQARRAAILMDATPIPPKQYALARCAAALTGGALLTLLCMVEAAVFYGRMFHWYSWGSLLLPALVTLLPTLVFALGSGWLAGQIRPWLVYVWMAVPFLLAALPLPDALGLWNGSFFTAYPLTLETLGRQSFTVDSWDSTHVTGHINVTTPGRLLLSIANEPGWTLKVDGAAAEIEEYDSMFISVELPEGEHEISLTFYPAGLNAGIAVSLISLGLFSAILIFRKRGFGMLPIARRPDSAS